MPDSDDVMGRTLDLLLDNVRTELDVQNGMWSLGLTDDVLERLAQRITANIDYAFSVRWSPDWVKEGGVHAWEENGRYLARCPTCLLDSPPMDSEAKACEWVGTHRESRHRT